ncbi:MAG: hypothetical protein NZ922_02980 [Candidatus Methanomethyliaceae archaeon]|nr:hypothetical protein [Candidatus Methanomethyliaceae archaeon]MDW7970827.1 DUF4443 domain-containing protein [Nitrososphaerota archaeon]
MINLKSVFSDFIQPMVPRGPSPAFSLVHLIKTLLLLENESMGRQTLSRYLNLGEGSVRTIIKRLSEKGLIFVDPVGGCSLTELGHDLVKKIREVIISEREINLKDFEIKSQAWAIHIRPMFNMTINITKLRDIAVKNGADGMLIFSFRDSKISLPLVYEDISRDFPEVRDLLIKSFELRDGDLIFVGFAENRKLAELSTLAAAISLFL